MYRFTGSGHYIQFLSRELSLDVRKVFGATERRRVAHYCEQMMLDEGFHAGSRYRLAQPQASRDVRFIVGLDAHAGMTVDEATKLFDTQAYLAASGRRPGSQGHVRRPL
jgi:hypothetical protein